MRIRPALVSAALAAVVTLPLALAPPSHAQYMFLDSNGDGVHSDADVLADSGTTTVDIWLATDRNRDGSPSVCAVDPSAGMTINSYEVILQALVGTVSWSNFTNHLPSATTSFGYRTDGTELYAGFGGPQILQPGLYRLATVEITPQTGTPSILVGRTSRLYPPGYTSFGCQCIGTDGDNTLKLGGEWHDAAGLLAPTATHLPVLDPVADLVMGETERKAVGVGAGDADGDPIALSLRSPPAFARYSESFNAPGRVVGAVELSPGYADSGNYSIVILASDGTHTSEAAFSVRVLDREPPPPPPKINHRPDLAIAGDVGVQPGRVRDIPIWVYDSDGDTLSVYLSGAPPFATVIQVRSEPGSLDASLRLEPTESDAGLWPLRVEATDGVLVAARDLQVTVGPNRSPILSRLDPIVLVEGQESRNHIFVADPDADSLWIDFGGLPRFATAPPAAGMGYVLAQIDARPVAGDAGEYSITVTASDGLTRIERTFPVTVLPRGNLPVTWNPGLGALCLDQGGVIYYGVTARDVSGAPLSIEVTHKPSWITVEGVGTPSVMLTITPRMAGLTGLDYVSLRAAREDGEWATGLLTFRLNPPGECSGLVCGACTFTGAGAGSPPKAEAGGPYYGFVGDAVRLDGRWSTPATALSWRFGDGTGVYGGLVEHRYAASGHYLAVLTSSWSGGVSRDTADVYVRDPIAVRAFVWPATRVLPLTDSKSIVEIRTESLEPEFDVRTLNVESACLKSTGLGTTDSIGVQVARPSATRDVDGNGMTEAAVPFSVGDLRRLFSDVRGKQDISARFEARSVSGAPIRGSLALTLLGTPSSSVQVGPNPFNPSGTIRFEVESAGPVRVRQFDVAGRLVRTYVDERVSAPGTKTVRIDGRDASGRTLASGIYFFRIERGDRVDRVRVIILK